MRVLIVQFVSPTSDAPLPSFSHSLGVLSALLKADGIDCRLVALPGSTAAKPGPRRDILRAALTAAPPDAVLVDINSYSVTAAHRTIAEILQTWKCPIVVCGQYATCRPRDAISIPGVKALLLGEFERSGHALMEAIRDGAAEGPLPGVWMHTAGGLVRGPVAPLDSDLDRLPWPDRDLFDYAKIVAATREVSFKVGRGCPQWCAFCVNDWYMDLYGDKGCFVRRRSVENVLEEVHSVVLRYPSAAGVAFYDHCFATDLNWLRAFSQAYPNRCALPYRCFVPLTCITPEVAALLAASKCRWVRTNVGSGSRFIREEVLSLHAGNERIVEACQIVRQAGLSLAVDVYVGSPYESEITVEETLALLRLCQADAVNAEVFFPTPGTRAAELCAENGWTSGRGEENYWHRQSVLDMPSLKAAQIDQLAAKLPSMVGGKSVLGRMLHRIIHSRLRIKLW